MLGWPTSPASRARRRTLIYHWLTGLQDELVTACCPGRAARAGHRVADRPGDLRRDRRARPQGPPRRGLRHRRRARTRADRPERFVPMSTRRGRPTFYEFDSADLLAALQGHGRPRRGAGGDLPLAHRHRGLPVPHRHVLAQRAGCPLRPGVHPRPRHDRVPVLPDHRRCGHRGTVEVVQSYMFGHSRPRSSTTVRRPRRAGRTRPHSQPTIAISPEEQAFHGYRRPHSDHPAQLHRRREGRRGAGDTLGALIDRPRRPAPGHQGAPGHRGRRPAPLRQRLRQRRGRPLHRRAGHQGQGRRLGDDPARGRRRLRPPMPRYDSLLDSLGGTPLVGLPRLSPLGRRAAVGQARGPQPDRVGQGPGRLLHDRRRPRRTGCSGRARRSSSPPAATPGSRWPCWPGCAATG